MRMKTYVCVYINNRIFKARTWKSLYSERTDYTGNQFYGKASYLLDLNIFVKWCEKSPVSYLTDVYEVEGT